MFISRLDLRGRHPHKNCEKAFVELTDFLKDLFLTQIKIALIKFVNMNITTFGCINIQSFPKNEHWWHSLFLKKFHFAVFAILATFLLNFLQLKYNSFPFSNLLVLQHQYLLSNLFLFQL